MARHREARTTIPGARTTVPGVAPTIVLVLVVLVGAFLTACTPATTRPTATGGTLNGAHRGDVAAIRIGARSTAPQTAAIGPVDAGRLKGMGSDGVRDVLGEPGLTRKDPPAEVWQYHGVGCVVDVFLYEDGSSRRVTYVDVRPLGGGPATGRVDDVECLSGISRANRPAG